MLHVALADRPLPSSSEFPGQSANMGSRKHLAGITPEPDFWLMGGAFMGSKPKEGETPDMKGSAMLCYAESEEEVRARLKKDIYVTSGVWNLDKVRLMCGGGSRKGPRYHRTVLTFCLDTDIPVQERSPQGPVDRIRGLLLAFGRFHASWIGVGMGYSGTMVGEQQMNKALLFP